MPLSMATTLCLRKPKGSGRTLLGPKNARGENQQLHGIERHRVRSSKREQNKANRADRLESQTTPSKRKVTERTTPAGTEENEMCE